MATAIEPDRLRALIDVLVESIDDPARGEELARRAHLSRFHFDRLVAAALGESPGAFRRRLLLERAGYQLSRGASMSEAALDAGYSCSEAFARAFRRAFASAPSAFHGDFRLAAPNGVHFHAGGEFARVVREVRDRGAWDTAFVDATCNPPESFTFGRVIAHALTWDAYRRQVVAAALRERGVEGLSADPLDWQR